MRERIEVDWAEVNNPGYQLFKDHHLALYRRGAQFIRDKVTKHSPRILDAAVGTGFGFDALSVLGQYVGLDADSNTLIQTRKARPNGDFRHCDFEQPWALTKIGAADVIVSFETAEHLKDPDTFLDRLHDLLVARNGILLFSAPTCRTMDFDEYHLHDRTTDEWRAALIRAGFDIIEEETFGFQESFLTFCRTVPTTWADKLRIARFILLRPRYLLDRVWNWLICRRFVWTTQYFACKLADQPAWVPAIDRTVRPVEAIT